MGIVFAILTCVLLGVGNVILKRSFKNFPPSISFFTFSIFSLFLWAPLGLFLGVDFNDMLLGLFVGFMSAILGQAIYFFVLEKGEVSITNTILSSFSIYTIIFSMIFNNERPTLLTLLFIGLTILGTIIVSLPERYNKKELGEISIILWAVFAAVCIGAADTLGRFYINKSSVGSFLFYVAGAQVVVSFLYLKASKQPLNQFVDIFKHIKEYKFALIGGLCISLATMFLFLAFNYTLASIASPIATSSCVITVLLALIFLKEKVSAKNWVGLVLVIISVIAIGIVSS